MKELFEKYSIEIEKETLSKFESFLKMFLEKNEVLNLSAIRERNDIIEKHFIDSLMLTKYIKLYGKIADIGTGGGFPLLPLAIYQNFEKNNVIPVKTGISSKDELIEKIKDTDSLKSSYSNSEIISSSEMIDSGTSHGGQNEFSGIDSISKKLKAIEEFAKVLELTNLKTIHSRFEDIGQDVNHREKYDFVISRATAYFPILLEYAIPLLKIGGIFIAYKMDSDDELKDSVKALKEFGSEIIKIEKYELGGTSRTLVFVKKLKETQKKYPRKPGVPQKEPLI